MVIRGNTRGNGRQLAHYLLNKGENDFVQILEADGWAQMQPVEFSNLLYDMSVTAELTKSKKGLYHSQINPAIGEDQLMNKEHWLQAADILGKELGLENQRRAIVLHEKKGRVHAHVVWERYDHDTGKIVSDSFSRLAQDRARMEMERVLELQKTPRRNAHRPELKTTLTELWQNTKTAKQFMREVDKAGYMLAEGTLRHPFMVVDENGRTYDLLRQLKGVRIKEVRERMKGEKLVHEKKAIELMRARGEQNKDDKGTGEQKAGAAPKIAYDTPTIENRNDITRDKRAMVQIAREFAETSPSIASKETPQEKGSPEIEDALAFRDNKTDVQHPLTKEEERERLRQEFLDKLQKDKQERDKTKGKDKARDYEY